MDINRELCILFLRLVLLCFVRSNPSGFVRSGVYPFILSILLGE